MKIDFHTHTSVSNDSSTPPEALIRAARRRGLDRIVVTDHNSITGALAAQKLDPELVIVGEEILTTGGELLAVFVTKEIPRGLSPRDAVVRLQEQGAFISVSHPFDAWRAWKLDELLEIIPLVDAIETFNARCASSAANTKAQELAQKYQLPGTAGSDAHAAFEVGAVHLELPAFRDADELRAAIREARVVGALSPFWVHFASRFAHLRKKVV